MFRRRRKRKWIMGVFILLLIGFVYGYMDKDIQILNKPNHISKENQYSSHSSGPVKKTNNKITEEKDSSNDSNDKITNNTKFELKTYYEKTRSAQTKESKIPVVFIGKSLGEFKNYLEENYGEWEIRKLSEDTVQLYRTVDEVTPFYYIAKENKGYIGIFKVNENGEAILIKQTQIPLSSLSNVDQEYLRQGIIKKDIDEINQILEDFSS